MDIIQILSAKCGIRGENIGLGRKREIKKDYV